MTTQTAPAPLPEQTTAEQTTADGSIADGTTAEEPRRSVPGLSPSRAADFQRCPLLFRLRVIDRLPEPASPAAARGTLVHGVLEDLFDLPRGARTLEAARGMVAGRWERLLAEDPRCAELFATPEELATWLGTAGDLLATYFTLEDPNRLEPAERELAVRLELEDGPQLRGIVDRLDVSPDGLVRVVDYKTGKSPTPGFEGSALFQMRFYAYVLWRTRGVLPALLQLEYLGDGTVVRHVPTEREMAVLEARVRALWAGLQQAGRSGRFEARPSRLCDWCSFRDRCPSFGGTVPPLDADAVERALGVRPDVPAAA